MLTLRFINGKLALNNKKIMDLSSTEQIFKVIKEKKSALILLPKNYNGDALSAALAFSLFLKKYGKKASIAVENMSDINNKYSFLPGINLISNKIFDSSKITIRVKTDRIKAKELSYEPKDDAIEIYITSSTEDGFKKQDIEIIEENISFDFVITIGAKSKIDLGLYVANNRFIDDKEIINIDINQKNTNFGSINFINSDQKILSELIFDIMSFENSELIDENIASCILTGIMEKTNGLKISDILSSTLANTSNLIDLGADKDLIYKKLFENSTKQELQNTAKILSNVNFVDNIAYSINENIDNNFNIRSIFFNNIANISNIDMFIVFNKINGIVYSQITTNYKYMADEITSEFKSMGNNETAQFAIASEELEKVVDIVLQKIKKHI